MQNEAEVVRFESQLTVPTRNRPHRSDLWFAISCTNSLAEWASDFGALAYGENDNETTFGTLEVVAMSEHKGWVVARGVDLSAHDSAEIEEKVRSVVLHVNSGVPPVPTVATTQTSTHPWSRIGAAVQSGGNSMRRVLSDSRPGPAVDAMSGR